MCCSNTIEFLFYASGESFAGPQYLHALKDAASHAEAQARESFRHRKLQRYCNPSSRAILPGERCNGGIVRRGPDGGGRWPEPAGGAMRAYQPVGPHGGFTPVPPENMPGKHPIGVYDEFMDTDSGGACGQPVCDAIHAGFTIFQACRGVSAFSPPEACGRSCLFLRYVTAVDWCSVVVDGAAGDPRDGGRVLPPAATRRDPRRDGERRAVEPSSAGSEMTI